MNDQVIILIRYALAAIVPVGVAKGWFTAAQGSDLANNIIALIGAAVPVVMAVWALVKSTKSAKVAAVQAMPDMQVATTNIDVAKAVPSVTLASRAAVEGQAMTVPVPAKPAA